MVEEQAIIVNLQDETALLEVIRNKPCGLCGQTRGCGVSLWGRLFRHRPSVFRAQNHVNAKVGDYVVVGIQEQAVLKSAMLVYGIPLLTMLIGALILGFTGNDNGNHDGRTVIGALIGLVFGLLWVKGHTAGRGLDSRYQPVILRVGN
jgi:sigma-E factor negative regulatory protein RseC